ncbi:helix-turn-helix transcriptional regulator [Cupriavidus nantongensis]|uniref:helix-turn-helix transcriptional regulator n=1 Tax=Cupriavidus nantongensis TaxID=1796606 RepID=UPI00358F2C3D
MPAKTPLPADPPALSMLDFDQFSKLLALLYEGPMEDIPWSRALEAIRTGLRANYVTLILRSPASGRSGLMVHASAQGTVLPGEASYNNYYFALDPFVNLPTDRIVTVDELVGDSHWRSSDMYKQFHQPFDVGYMMGADLRTEDGVECRLRICRSHQGTNFSDADKAACGALLPHLKRAVRLHSRFDIANAERKLYVNAFDRMLVGTIMLDESGAVMQTNPLADEIFAENDGMRRRGATLELKYQTEDRKFQKLVRQALAERAANASSVVHAVAVSRPSGKPRLGVLIRNIPLGEGPEDTLRRPACAIFVRDPARKSLASQELVGKLFAFTPAESSLALALTNGLTLEEAGEELGISKNTARAHLRAIYAKTGVTRQATLVGSILNSVFSLG